jgi:hypothetical protein
LKLLGEFFWLLAGDVGDFAVVVDELREQFFD